MTPGWNAHVNVENAKVGLGWAVTDDVPGNPLDYVAVITLTLPQGAQASIEKKSPNETVVLEHDASLTCGPNAIQARVTYHVSPGTVPKGKEVAVKVCKNAGQKPPPTGDILGGATGQIGQDITVSVLIPGTCA